MKKTELKFNTFKNNKISEIDFWDELCDEQKAEIEESIAQADRGEVISHEEVMARIKERYNL